jgi:hypothetical protein
MSCLGRRGASQSTVCSNGYIHLRTPLGFHNIEFMGSDWSNIVLALELNLRFESLLNLCNVRSSKGEGELSPLCQTASRLESEHVSWVDIEPVLRAC